MAQIFNGNNMGFNNGGFNNGQGGYPQQQVQQGPVNAQAIINEIQQAVFQTKTGLANVFHVRDTVLRMQREGKLKILGGGMNRVAVELNADMSGINNQYGMGNLPTCIKVPVKVYEGTDDNRRAEEAWTFVRNSGLNTDAAMQFLRNRQLPSVMIQGTDLLLQRKVIRIEDSTGVYNMLQSGKYTADTIGAACRDYILTNPKIYPQYIQLLTAMDRYYIMDDMSPEWSAFNYGLFMDNAGNEYLTILDYGYVIPRSLPCTCPKCGKELHFVIPGEDFLKDPRNKAIAANAKTANLYSCKNPQCTYNPGSGISTSYFVKASEVFSLYEKATKKY